MSTFVPESNLGSTLGVISTVMRVAGAGSGEVPTVGHTAKAIGLQSLQEVGMGVAKQAVSRTAQALGGGAVGGLVDCLTLAFDCEDHTGEEYAIAGGIGVVSGVIGAAIGSIGGPVGTAAGWAVGSALSVGLKRLFSD